MSDIIAIRAARERIGAQLQHTPLLRAPLLDRIAGRRVWVKAECLQLTGSFKFRGASNAIACLPEGQQHGVLAYSSGNHAQGVAYAALLRGLAAVIIMPSDAPAQKIAATQAYGAEVILYDRATESREEIGDMIAAERGFHLIRPYDDPNVIAGQGIVGLEIAEQAQAAGVTQAEVLVCCGGGGLSAGIALALEAEAPRMLVRTVEPEGFDDMARSLESGERLSNSRRTGSICDAILTPSPGALTFPIIARLAGAGLTVSDDAALQAMALAAQHLKIMAEPGGAVALAAALSRDSDITGEVVICVISGGNVDPAVLARALSEHNTHGAQHGG